MKNIYASLLLSCFIIGTVNGQFVYKPETSYTLPGTYTDLGSSGTIIATANKDDANSSAQAIGFGFNYNGTSYTHFILNTNGFIKLGTSASMTAPSSGQLGYKYFNMNIQGGVLSSSNANDTYILSVFNHDLESSSTLTTEYRFLTTGTTGNRICTIQFKNVTDKAITDSSGTVGKKQFNSMNFQIKLYESSKAIEYIYGNFGETSDTSFFKLAAVGLKGAGGSQILVAQKGSSHEWDLTTFVNGNYTTLGATAGYNFGNNNQKINKAIPTNTIRPLPDAGRRIIFYPQIQNDAHVKPIYTYHAHNIPWGLPHNITARVTNVGTNSMTGIWARLNISGANTYQDSVYFSSLGVGISSTATFSGYVPQNLGTDLVTVTLSNDNRDENNAVSWQQKVTRNELGFADTSHIYGSVGWASGSGIFANKYQLVGKRRISKVRIQIGSNPNAVGQMLFGVVVDASNNIVGESANHTITKAELTNWVELEINGGSGTGPKKPPPVITNGVFYAGVAVPAAGYNPVGMQQEIPYRSGAYYYHGGVSSGGTYTELATAAASFQVFRLSLNARLSGTSLKLEPLAAINDPSCAVSNKTIEVTVTNQDSITTDFSEDTLHLEVVSTGAKNQKFTRLVNSGTLAPGASATFLITNTFDLSVAGQYNIVVEARQWMEIDTANNYKTMIVNVVDTPAVKLKVKPDSVLCYGVPFTFIATPYTAGSTLYQWKINGINSGGTTTDSSFAPALTWGDVVSVDLITDHCTTGTFTVPSNEIMMKINPKPRFINGITDVDTVIEFKKKTYGIGVVSGHVYLWKVSGGTIVGDSTGSTLQVTWGGPNTNAYVSVSERDLTNCTYNNVLPVVIISIVGVGENTGIGIGEAYPNPADHSVNIPVHASKSGQIDLELFDLTGKKVMDIYHGGISGNKTFSLDVSALNEGLYFYKIRTSDGFEKVSRLAIRH